MIELVLVYCLAMEPDRCMERREPMVELASPMACTMNAQTIGLHYVEAHPRWHLAGWRCELDHPRENPA